MRSSFYENLAKRAHKKTRDTTPLRELAGLNICGSHDNATVLHGTHPQMIIGSKFMLLSGLILSI